MFLQGRWCLNASGGVELRELRSEQEIMKDWKGDASKPLVSICCLAYNHEPYIEDALEGFLIQRTDFPFEILIHDDASTDRTADIIREYEANYPNLIKPIYQRENQYSQGIRVTLTYQYPRALGKYIAMCEGDDYWIDPYKLQKQVDFLENNTNYGMVYSKAKMLIDKRENAKKDITGEAFNDKELLLSNTIPTLTTIFKKDLFHRYILEVEPEKYCWEIGDYPIWLWFQFNSNIYFQPEITGVYRQLAESASHSSNVNRKYKFKLSSFNVSDYYAKRHCTDDEHKAFLEHMYLFLYLFCLKHNIPDKNEYIKLLKKLKKINCRTKIIITIFYDLKFEYAFILLNQNHIFRRLLKKWGARISGFAH